MPPKKRDKIRDDVYPSEVPRHSKALKKEFKPWHKPRKQWVREELWNKSLSDLIAEVSAGPDRPLVYLGLPGIELLDIRAFNEVCKTAGASLKCLGFNSDLKEARHLNESNLSSHEVTHLSHITFDSIVLPKSIERISNTNSLAHTEMANYGPFDVVNFDLCESVAVSKPRTNESYYEALRALVTYQANNRTEPWLLLLTTRASRKVIDRTAMEKLLRMILDNSSANIEFKDSLKNHLKIEERLINSELAKRNRKNLNPTHFFSLFGLGIGKWLVNLMINNPPHWRVRMISACGYAVYGHRPDMLSVVLKFEHIPHQRQDSVGLAISQPKRQLPTEAEIAIPIIEEMGKLTNVDTWLRNNPKIFDAMVKNFAKLLAGARYDPIKYAEWVRDEYPA
jgi:hypothetical protein